MPSQYRNRLTSETPGQSRRALPIHSWQKGAKLGSRHDATSKFELVERSILLV